MTVDTARDAYAQMMLAVLDGDDALEIVERNDGFISASVIGPKLYLAPFRATHGRAARMHALMQTRIWNRNCEKRRFKVGVLVATRLGI